jgi:anti-sigma factor RsiW
MNQTHPSIEQIVDFLHGEVAAADAAAIEAHLAICPECQRRRAEESAITDALRAYARATEREAPPPLLARIRAGAVQAQLPSLGERLRGMLRPALVLPIAAAIAVVLYLTMTSRQGSSTAIDAAYYVNEHAALAAKSPFADDVLPAMLTSDDETH